MLIVMLMFWASGSFAIDKVIRIGVLPIEDKVRRIQPVSMTNALVQSKVVDTATEVVKKTKEPYRYKRPVHEKPMYKDILICKHGYCRVVRVFNL